MDFLDKICILYTNADQLLNKMDDLNMLIAGNEPELIIITEILPKSHCISLSAARLSLPGYQAYFNFDPHSQQSLQHRRGVGIYVSNKLSASEVHFNNYISPEHVWIKINLRGHDSLLVGCVYRSPSSNLQQSTSALCELLTSYKGYSHIVY